MGTPSSARVIEDVYLALKALEIVYPTNGAAVEGLDDRNGHIRKVAGEGKLSVGEVHGPRVRGSSAISLNICS